MCFISPSKSQKASLYMVTSPDKPQFRLTFLVFWTNLIRLTNGMSAMVRSGGQADELSSD